MDVTVLIEPKLDLARLAEVLDGLGHEGRVHTIRTWHKAAQARLFEAASGFRPIGLDHLVPPPAAPLAPVRHHGMNSLGIFSHFEKRFCRPAETENGERLYGYNHSPTQPFTGPGYFVAKPSSSQGEVIIDYDAVPTAKPADWPEIASNEAGLARIVFARMVDHLRGLSSHVSIGRAERRGRLTDHYFVLCRQDPA